VKAIHLHQSAQEEMEDEEEASGAKASGGDNTKLCWKDIRSNFLDQIIKLFKKHCAEGDEKLLADSIQAFSTVCELVPAFFKPRFIEVVEMFKQVAGHESLDFDREGENDFILMNTISFNN
jgi:hypothetical protein